MSEVRTVGTWERYRRRFWGLEMLYFFILVLAAQVYSSHKNSLKYTHH